MFAKRRFCVNASPKTTKYLTVFRETRLRINPQWQGWRAGERPSAGPSTLECQLLASDRVTPDGVGHLLPGRTLQSELAEEGTPDGGTVQSEPTCPQSDERVGTSAADETLQQLKLQAAFQGLSPSWPRPAEGHFSSMVFPGGC